REAGNRRAVHREGERGARVPERGEPVRLLRGDGNVPREIPAQASNLIARVMATWIVVLAAGGGTRFGDATPKQYADLGGAPVLARTLARLATLDADAIVVALAPDDVHYDDAIGARERVLPLRCGGATRAATVRKALQAIAPRVADDDWILVHDAARPCVSRDALARFVNELRDDA